MARGPSPELIRELIDLAGRGLSRVQLAKYAGVTRQTLHRWGLKFPALGDALPDAPRARRRRKLDDPDTRSMLLLALRSGFSPLAACSKAGIPLRMLYRALDGHGEQFDQDLRDQVVIALGEASHAEEELIQALGRESSEDLLAVIDDKGQPGLLPAETIAHSRVTDLAPKPSTNGQANGNGSAAPEKKRVTVSEKRTKQSRLHDERTVHYRLDRAIKSAEFMERRRAQVIRSEARKKGR